jgi:ATP/ADP translocase
MILPEVRREERRRFAYAIGAFMCVASAALIARTIGDTIYLTRFGAGRLPLMYVGTAIVIAVLSFAYARVAAHWPVAKVIGMAGVLIFIGCAALRFSLQATDWGGVRVAAYFFSELIIRLPPILFWTYVAHIFNPREAKRMVGLIGAGGTLACILAGAFIPRFVRLWGTPSLLWVVAALIAGFAFLVSKSGGGNQKPAAGTTANVGLGYYASMLRREQVRIFATLIALASFALIVNDFVFKSTARAAFTGRDLAAFFGSFYAIASIAALLLQLFVVHHVLARAGLNVALRVLPVALLLGSLTVVITGSFGSVMAAKFVEPFLDFTINVAAIQMLYLGIAKQSRQQVRAFIDGITRPVAVALAGGAILTTSGLLSARQLEGIVAVVCVAWIWAARKNYAAYTQGLSESIGARRFDISADSGGLTDPAVSAHVREALRSAPDEDIPYILALLSYWTDMDWTPEYRALLGRQGTEVKMLALEYLAQHGDASDLPSVEMELNNPDGDVRGVAVRAVAALGRGKVSQLLWDRINKDTVASVRAIAAAELINHGNLDDLIEGAKMFRAMVASTEAPERAAAAQSIGLIGREAVASALAALLADRDAEVQLVALDGIRAQPSDALVEPVAELIRDPRVGWKAAETLAAFGPRAVAPLRLLIRECVNKEPPPRYAFLLPGVLGKIGDAGMSLLGELIDAEDLQLRHDAIRAFCEAARKRGTTAADEPIERVLEREISRAQHALTASNDLRDSGRDLVVHALRDEYELHVDALLHLLQLRIPSLEPSALLDTLLSGDRRAEALELLDNLLPARWKASVLSLFETKNRVVRPVDETLGALLGERSSMWVTIAAVFAVGELRLHSLSAAVTQAGERRSGSSIRETVDATLAKLDEATKVRQTGAQVR